MPEPDAPITDDTKLVNCAECGREATGDSERIRAAIPHVYTRIRGRPYCNLCMRLRPRGGGGPVSQPEAGPSWDNAVRAYEEDR